jgi:UDP-N-acetylmuramoylalanine--D-glutamate ligase
MMNLKDKKTLIVGLGRTGLAAARFLHQKGARVLVADTADETQLGDSARTLREMGVALELGAHRTSSFQKADLIIVSPGVSHTIDPIGLPYHRPHRTGQSPWHPADE